MNSTVNMQDPLGSAIAFFRDARNNLQKIPGSSIVTRYIQSSYQDDPVRSAMELFLILFAVYYLVSPTYSTKKEKNVPLTDEVGCANAVSCITGLATDESLAGNR